MKACVFGISDFPFGKKALPDERLEKVKELYRSQKVTSIQVEFTTEKDLKTADAIVCPQDKKLDLILLDIDVLEVRSAKPLTDQEQELVRRCQDLLGQEKPLSEGTFTDEERKWLGNNNLVTNKPIVLILPEEVAQLSVLTRKVFDAAGRALFLTGGPKEARAWEIRKNATALEAAECIHSDIARGFIRAEVMAYNDLVKAGNVHEAKNTSQRQEPKNYVVRDGDVIEFKFSV